MNLTMERSPTAQELIFTLTVTTADMLGRVTEGTLHPTDIVRELRTLDDAFQRGMLPERLEAVRNFLNLILPAPVV